MTKLSGTNRDRAVERTHERSMKSMVARYLLAGAAAFAFGSATPSCGSGNPDSIINIPPLSSDGGVDASVSDGGATADGGNCLLPPGACVQQTVQSQQLNVGDSVVMGGYRFLLTGTGESEGDQFATFNVLDACGNPLVSSLTIRRGETQTVHIDGTNEDIAVSVPNVTVLSPQTATVSATVSCGLDGGVTDGGTEADAGSGGSDSGAGGNDGGAAGDGGALNDGGTINDGGTESDAGSGGDGGAGGSDGGVVNDAGEAGADAGSGGSDGGMGGMDGGVSDGGSVLDAGSEGGADGGVVSDGGEAGADGGVALDGGSEGGAPDAGIVCGSTTTGSWSGMIHATGTQSVFNYTFGYIGVDGSGNALMSLSCGGQTFDTSVTCPVGVETDISRPADGTAPSGRTIRITPSYANATNVNLFIRVTHP